MRAICPWLRAWNHTTLKIAYRRKLQRRMAALGILPCGSHLRPPRPLRSRYSGSRARSEEHTSELQSRLHLVCRLLLEKKKKDTHNNLYSTTHDSTAYT